MSRLLPCLLLCAAAIARAQQPAPPAAPPATPPAEATDAAPLPDIDKLVLDVERNQRAAEAARKDYTYHLHEVDEEFDGHDAVKKTETTDYDSFILDGVPVTREVAKDGKPLSPAEAKKQDEAIDKEVAKAKANRAKLDAKGKDSDPRGDEIIPASRILELGTFSNPRRVTLNGRPTIAADFAGDPNAKTHNPGEVVIRDLVGTVWFDEKDRNLVQAEGHFLNDFKLGGGLFMNIHKGFSFSFSNVKVNDEVWLPAVLEGRGEARFVLVYHVHGRASVTASDYRKFRSSSRIVGESAPLGPDDQPIPAAPPADKPATTDKPQL